jgi:tRNA (cmo5U34)-methyltransferase
VLDLGAGTGLLSAIIAAAFPKARLTLFDLAPEMLMIACARLKPLGKRVRFVTADFAAAAPSKSYDAVVSALALHHLPDSGKRHLFADIFKYLTSGGVFINADQVGSETAAIDQRSRQIWLKRARELKVAKRDLNAAVERMKHDLPATVGQQLAWMRESGFPEVHLRLPQSDLRGALGHETGQCAGSAVWFDDFVSECTPGSMRRSNPRN